MFNATHIPDRRSLQPACALGVLLAVAAALPAVATSARADTFAPMRQAGSAEELRFQRLNRSLDEVSARFDGRRHAPAPRAFAVTAYPRAAFEGHRVTSGYGLRIDPFTGRLAEHRGVDFSAPLGTPVTAAAGGRVRFVGLRPAYGLTVEIDHGEGLATRYAHLSRPFVRAGDIVVPRQTIAAVGSTGRSTGPHLHYEVLRNGRQVEPRSLLFHWGE